MDYSRFTDNSLLFTKQSLCHMKALFVFIFNNIQQLVLKKLGRHEHINLSMFDS